MSERTATLPGMRVSERALTAWLAGEGFTVVEFDGEGDLWGYTDQLEREVGLWRGLLQRQRIPALLHETFHVQNGHSGHQTQCVEDRINEGVARALVDPLDYAFYEAQFGWSTGGIAHELGLPRWVIEAYRRALSRERAA